MTGFWTFFLYSFLGFLLEVAYAVLTGGRRQRKCFLLLPLCPVYGLGALGILAAAILFRDRPLLMAAAGTLAATAAEYLMALFYEQALGVRFWDYSALPANLNGRVCLWFSAAWGVLSLLVVYVVHPRVEGLLSRIPVPVTAVTVVVTAVDALASIYLMGTTGSITCLKWYGK